jgi:hypothetical protein
MMDNIIKCPNCGAEIEVTGALFSQIKDSLKDQMQAEFQEKEGEFRKKLQGLEKREVEIGNRSKQIDEEVTRRLELDRKQIVDEEKKKAQQNLSLEMEDLKNQLNENREKLLESQKNELNLRKKERELQDKADNLDLEIAKQLAKEREKLKKDAFESVSEQHKLREADLKNQIRSLTEKIDVLKQASEQGSQEAQGEVLETELEDLLRLSFPDDNINPVPKGVSGADILQEVVNDMGITCGRIIWESKRTKLWSEGWIDKLKVDQRKVKADIAVILSMTLPKGVDNFAFRAGVWITGFGTAIAIASALRHGLMQLSATKSVSTGKGKKMELLYSYLSGPEFRGRIEAMAEAFTGLKKGLDKEKTAMHKIWAQREKQIEKVMFNTVSMYGDLQGIIGASLPEIAEIELKALPDKE